MHMVGTVHEATYGVLVPDVVSGVIHFGLSLRSGGASTLLQEITEEYIEANIDIKEGEPPAECVLRQRLFLRLCLARGTSLVERREAIAQANGNWNRTGTVELWVPRGAQYDEHNLKKTFATNLAYGLCGFAFDVYGRNNWNGGDLAFDEAILFEARVECPDQRWHLV
jgi:hypothetical protein